MTNKTLFSVQVIVTCTKNRRFLCTFK